MFVVIVVSTLVTLLVIIITTICYLISVLSNDEADDDIDMLNIAHNFSSSPAVSPDSSIPFHSCNNPKNVELHNSVNQCLCDSRINLPNALATSEIKENSASSSKSETITPHETCNDLSSLDANSASSESGKNTLDTPPTTSSWDTSVSAQKILIIGLIGNVPSKAIFDDFDTKELQLGGTGLHWCKSRKSLDKLVQIGVPINHTNRHQETALHVAVRKKRLQVLIGLLCHDADVSKVNENGETPLILATKMNDIIACQLLLIFDSEVDAVDNHGLTARHYAAVICERSKNHQQPPSAAHLILSMLNSMGASRCPESASMIQNSSSTRRRPSSFASCADGCSCSGSYNGNQYNRWPDFEKESLYRRGMSLDILNNARREKLARAQSQSKVPIRASRLLCIDGGGMRGVLVCQIMIEMEKYLRRPVIDYFDWIGGTSAGAFIAGALCTGSSLRHLRRFCFDVKDEVFNGSRPYNHKILEKLFKKTLGSSTRMSDIKEKKLAITTVVADREPCQLRIFRNYQDQTVLLEHYGFPPEIYNSMSSHSNVVRKDTLASGSSLKSTTSGSKSSKSIATSDSEIDNNKTCNKEVSISQIPVITKIRDSKQSLKGTTKSIIATKSVISAEEEQKNSKESKSETINDVIDENDKDPLLWQTVRASGAAPFFFKPYGPYLDGGIISNNPTLDMLTEFFNLEGTKRFLRDRLQDKKELNKMVAPVQLDLVVSLGTGRGRIIGKPSMVDFSAVASGIARVFSPVELIKSVRAARDLFRKLMQQSCHTEDHIIDRAQAWCSSIMVPYFRINPPLTTLFPIDDKRDEQLINALWQAKLYMHSRKSQLEELAELLDGDTNIHLLEREM